MAVKSVRQLAKRAVQSNTSSMNKSLIFTVLAMLLVCGLAFAANAQPTAGKPELALLETILTGNVGLGFGLLVTAIGIYQVAMGRGRGGFVLILLGVAFTVLPGIYNGVRDVMCGIATGLGGQCGTPKG